MGQPEHTDVVVLGLGPGGEYVAGTLAEAGLHVTGIESRLVGGECPYYGCVPSKMMVRAANLIAETRRVPGMAGTSAITPDWSPVAERIREEATDNWNDKVAADRFTGKGGHLVRGRGKITGTGQVTVTGAEGTRVFQARQGIVINTGTEPAIPPLPGRRRFEGKVVAITGGGAASVFAICHGAGNGILTIARGTLPLAMFGPENYGYRLGLIGAPARMKRKLPRGAPRLPCILR